MKLEDGEPLAGGVVTDSDWDDAWEDEDGRRSSKGFSTRPESLRRICPKRLISYSGNSGIVCQTIFINPGGRRRRLRPPRHALGLFPPRKEGSS